MTTPLPPLESSDQLRAKLLASQERQALIMRAIAEKERRIDQAQRGGASNTIGQSNAASSSSSSSTISRTTTTSTLTTTPQHPLHHQPPHDQYSFLSSSSSIFPSQSIGGGTSSSMLQEEKYASTGAAVSSPPPMRSPITDSSVQHDRTSAALLNQSTLTAATSDSSEDAASTSMRLRQLSSQIRFSKAEHARKDILLSTLQAQLASLSQVHQEYHAAKVQWEVERQQNKMKEEEARVRSEQQQTTIQRMLLTEETLRNEANELTREKLTSERDLTHQLGQSDTQVQALSMELNTRRAELTQSSQELSLAKREIERLVHAMREYEATQANIQHQHEEKYTAIQREQQTIITQYNALNESHEKLIKEFETKSEALDTTSTELLVHQRTRATQQALIESLQRELTDIQLDRTQLRAQVDQIPQLKQEIHDSSEIRHQLRTAQLDLASAQAQHHTLQSSHDHLLNEKSKLTTFIHELEVALHESRERYHALISPQGELEHTKREKLEAEELYKKLFYEHTKLESMYEEGKKREEETEKEMKEMNMWIVQTLGALQQRLETRNVSGAGTASSPSASLSSSLNDSFSLPLPPSAFSSSISPSLHSLSSNLTLSLSSLLHDLSSSQVKTRELQTKLEEAEQVAYERVRTITKLENDVVQAQEKMNSKQQEYDSLLDEIDEKRHDLYSLSLMYNQLMKAEDEKSGVVKVWKKEMEDLIRNLAFVKVEEDSLLIASASINTSHTLDHSTSSSSAAVWHSLQHSYNTTFYHLTSSIHTLLQHYSSLELRRKEQDLEIETRVKEMETIKSHIQATLAEQQAEAERHMRVVEETEKQRVLDVQKIMEEANQRCQQIQAEYEILLSTLQSTHHQQTLDMLSMRQTNLNLHSALRVFYKCYRPLYSRYQEMCVQKDVAMRLIRQAKKEQDGVRELMRAMSGGNVSISGQAKDGVRALNNPRRAMFRAGVIAILAYRRLLYGSHAPHQYGRLVQVRNGQQLSILESESVKPDTDSQPSAAIPLVDDSSVFTSAQSIMQLLAHFEPFSVESTRPLSHHSLLARLTSSRSSSQQSDARNDPLSIIRRLALSLVTRNRQLEHDLSALQTELWSLKETQKEEIKSVEYQHEQEKKRVKEMSEYEKMRWKQMEEENMKNLQTIKSLETQLTQLRTERTSLVTSFEYSELKQSRDDALRQFHSLQVEHQKLQHALAVEQEKCQTYIEVTGKQLMALREEQTTVTKELHIKSTELLTHERDRLDSLEIQSELKMNLDMCMMKNAQLIEYITSLEKEIHEQQLNNQQMHASLKQIEAEYNLQQASLQHADRELVRAQEVIRTLTNATRVAADELDTQAHIRLLHQAEQQRRAAQAQPLPPLHSPPARFSSTTPTPLNTSIHSSASNTNTSTTFPASTLHLRHHPGAAGHLSVDMSNGPTTRVPNIPSQQSTPADATRNQLRFDDLPPAQQE